MDPNTVLTEIRALIERASAARSNEEAGELYGDAAEKFGYLDNWLSQGGFLPAPWDAHQSGRTIP